MAWSFGRTERDERFLSMLVRQTAKAVVATKHLEHHAAAPDDAAVDALRALGTEAAELRRVIVDELHKTFITPLDREDIFNLSHCYEDIVLYAVTTLEEMRMLAVDADPQVLRMIALVREEAEQLELASQRLAKNPLVAGEHASRVRALEVEVERTYRLAIKELFAHADQPARLPAILYRRELYRHLSNMSDRADAAANVLGMVVMKLS